MTAERVEDCGLRPDGRSSPRPVFSLAEWLTQLQKDPFARAGNHAALSNELAGWWAVALLQLSLTLSKTVLREQQPLLAAVGATNALLAVFLAALIRWRPRLYAAAREPLIFLASLHLSFVMLSGVLHGNSNVLGQHGGSPLRMLTLLLVAGPAAALCFYALYARLSLAWNVFALPLLAAAPALLGGGAVCRRMLSTPGAEAPLETLHTLLALAHSVTFDLLPRGAPPSAMQLCWQVNAWSLVAVGALLPLLALRSMERTARRRWDEEQQRSAAGAGTESETAADSADVDEQAAADGSGEASSQPDPVQATPPLRPPGWWLLEPWLASALVWRTAGVAAALLAPAA